MPKGDELTAKQKAFVREYLLCRNASEAMRRAGYTTKHADTDAAKLLVNPRISRLIAQAEKKAQDKFEITQERILKTLAAMAFTELDEIMEWDGDDDRAKLKSSKTLTKRQLAAIDSVEGRVTEGGDRYLVMKRADRMKALHLLGKHTGLWKELKDAGPEGTDSGSREALLGRVQGLLRKRKGSGSPPGASET